jgi:hypothetical protein
MKKIIIISLAVLAVTTGVITAFKVSSSPSNPVPIDAGKMKSPPDGIAATQPSSVSKQPYVREMPLAGTQISDIGRRATLDTGVANVRFVPDRSGVSQKPPKVDVPASEVKKLVVPTVAKEIKEIPTTKAEICSTAQVSGVKNEACAIEDHKSPLKFVSEEAYDSEYVHRGRKLGQAVGSSHGAVSYPVKNGTFYAGIRSRTEFSRAKTSGPALSNAFNKQFEASFGVLVPYVRYEHRINDIFSATVGYMHYYYPYMCELNDSVYEASNKMMKLCLDDHTNEIFAGIWADVMFRPTLYVFYNFDCDEFVAVAHAFLKYNLCKIGLANSHILVDTFIGFDHATKPYGLDWSNSFWYKNPLWGTINGKKAYIFGGVKTSLVYALNEHTRMKASMNFETNGNGGMSWTNFTGWGSRRGVKRMLWYSMALECNF